MIENLWILKYKVMVMLNICNPIKLKPISKNPQRFTTRVKPISKNPERFPIQVTIITKFVFKRESHEGLIFLMK